ncbi:MAG: hypothetical protein Q4G68_04610 [Planctomycetia bacterium]|nr:hypothetical protein [Planctomycetia bacterium]
MKYPYLFTCLLVLLLAGCNRGMHTVSGRVLYDDKAVDKGTIAFIAEEGRGSAYGGDISSGKYKVHVPNGDYLVMIHGEKKVRLDKPIEIVGLPPKYETTEELIPECYNMYSTLKYTVDQKSVTQDFILEKADFSSEAN